MNQNLIYYPCMSMLLLTFIVLLRMFFLRVSAVKSGSIEMKYFKTYDSNVTTPPLMAQASRNFSNLFEVPTLFYMVCGFALITKSADTVMLVAAWLYVAFRIIHSIIHLTKNKIRHRMMIYFYSWLVLLFMGMRLGYQIFLQGH